jgi:hypothetical protein
MKTAAFALSCVLLAGPAMAREAHPTKTINDLRELCIEGFQGDKKSADMWALLAECVYYIQGVQEALRWNGYLLRATMEIKTPLTPSLKRSMADNAICQKNPDDYYDKEPTAVFMEWANKNRHRGPQDKLFGVIAALHEAWPCQ